MSTQINIRSGKRIDFQFSLFLVFFVLFCYCVLCNVFITYLNFCLISVFFFSLLFRVLFRNVNVCLFLITLAHYWTLVCISLLICVLLIWGIYFGRVVTMKNGSDQVRCGKMLVTATCELAQRKKVIYWICSHIGRDWVCNFTKKKKQLWNL